MCFIPALAPRKKCGDGSEPMATGLVTWMTALASAKPFPSVRKVTHLFYWMKIRSASMTFAASVLRCSATGTGGAGSASFSWLVIGMASIVSPLFARKSSWTLRSLALAESSKTLGTLQFFCRVPFFVRRKFVIINPDKFEKSAGKLADCLSRTAKFQSAAGYGLWQSIPWRRGFQQKLGVVHWTGLIPANKIQSREYSRDSVADGASHISRRSASMTIATSVLRCSTTGTGSASSTSINWLVIGMATIVSPLFASKLETALFLTGEGLLCQLFFPATKHFTDFTERCD